MTARPRNQSAEDFRSRPPRGASDVLQGAPRLKIDALGEINVSRYDVVGRPWVDSWRSAFFWVPTFPSQEQAIAALQTEAARRARGRAPARYQRFSGHRRGTVARAAGAPGELQHDARCLYQ